MTCSFKRALEITLLNRLTPNLKHFVIILHLDYFVPTIFCTIFCTEIREWYTKHIGELKYWENRSSSRRQKMWCLHITIELNKIWDEIVNNFITKQIDYFYYQYCVYLSGIAITSVTYKEKLSIIDVSKPLKSSLKFGFYFSHLQFASAKMT